MLRVARVCEFTRHHRYGFADGLGGFIHCQSRDAPSSKSTQRCRLSLSLQLLHRPLQFISESCNSMISLKLVHLGLVSELNLFVGERTEVMKLFCGVTGTMTPLELGDSLCTKTVTALSLFLPGHSSSSVTWTKRDLLLTSISLFYGNANSCCFLALLTNVGTRHLEEKYENLTKSKFMKRPQNIFGTRGSWCTPDNESPKFLHA